MVIYTFPFGGSVLPVVQKDRSQKKVFILGVYASAVHARWVGASGKVLVNAIGVASEPEIFWSGAGAQAVLDRIEIPTSTGHLEPAGCQFNGPSGRALDDNILGPLGVNRADAWLCDLIPYSCMNPGQQKAIQRAYRPFVETGDLPEPNWPTLPKELATEARRSEILADVLESMARVVITLGDRPLLWFARYCGANSRLASYGSDATTYGRLHRFKIGDSEKFLLPLVHPRQAARLGRHSHTWWATHREWERQTASRVLRDADIV